MYTINLYSDLCLRHSFHASSAKEAYNILISVLFNKPAQLESGTFFVRREAFDSWEVLPALPEEEYNRIRLLALV